MRVSFSGRRRETGLDYKLGVGTEPPPEGQLVNRDLAQGIIY
jgi:hypothetical protein